jgi:hypothetical protein
MRSIASIMAAILVFSVGCGGVVKENSEEKAVEQPDPSENEYDFGAYFRESPFIVPQGINITLTKEDTVSIEVFGIDGEKTGIYIRRFLESGDNFVPLNLDNLMSGVYNIDITNSDTTITKPISILR